MPTEFKALPHYIQVNQLINYLQFIHDYKIDYKHREHFPDMSDEEIEKQKLMFGEIKPYHDKFKLGDIRNLKGLSCSWRCIYFVILDYWDEGRGLVKIVPFSEQDFPANQMEFEDYEN